MKKLFILICFLHCAALGNPTFNALLSQSASFSPSDVSGLVIWLVADDVAGSDGDAIQTWSAHGTTSISASQATSAARSILKTSFVNGHNAILADGVDDYYSLSSTVSSAASWTVFVVQKRSASGAQAFALGNSGAVPGVPYSPYEYGFFSRIYMGIRSDQKYATIPSHAWHVLTGQDSSGTIGLWVDGSSQSLTAASATSSDDFTMLFKRSTSEFSAIYLAELIFYNRTVTSTERANVETYLKTRYATP